MAEDETDRLSTENNHEIFISGPIFTWRISTESWQWAAFAHINSVAVDEILFSQSAHKGADSRVKKYFLSLRHTYEGGGGTAVVLLKQWLSIYSQWLAHSLQYIYNYIQ